MNITLNESLLSYDRFKSVKVITLIKSTPDPYLTPLIKSALTSAASMMNLNGYNYPLDLSDDVLRQLYTNVLVRVSEKTDLLEQEPMMVLREMCRQFIKKFPELADIFL